MGLSKLFGFTNKAEERQKWMVQNATEFTDQVKQAKSLPVINTPLFLNGDEKAVMQEKVSFLTLRSVRQSSGGYGGMRIAKGVSVGGYSGTAESHKEWRLADIGDATLTSKRLIFVGGKEDRTIDLNKIISINCALNEIHLSVGGKESEVSFKVNNPFVWYAAIGILKKAADPFALKDGEVAVSFG